MQKHSINRRSLCQICNGLADTQYMISRAAHKNIMYNRKSCRSEQYTSVVQVSYMFSCPKQVSCIAQVAHEYRACFPVPSRFHASYMYYTSVVRVSYMFSCPKQVSCIAQVAHEYCACFPVPRRFHASYMYYTSRTSVVHVFLSQTGFMYRTSSARVLCMFSCPKQVSCIIQVQTALGFIFSCLKQVSRPFRIPCFLVPSRFHESF